jgi:quaternary ammonium compound-resistance protein SugE
MSWYVLVVAGLFEVAWTVGHEYSDGFTRPVASIATVVALCVSMLLLDRVVRALPVGTALLGVALFDEPATLARLGFVAVVASASSAPARRRSRARG